MSKLERVLIWTFIITGMGCNVVLYYAIFKIATGCTS
jgi:hypothetical protein